jgi:cytochrome c-type biogenesis protein CcmF
VISLLGRTAVLLGLALCSVGLVTGVVAATRRSADALKLSRWMAYGFGATMVLATGLMEFALLTHDFSVAYVSEVGSTKTPVWVTIVSLWSSLDGSILLWGFVLGIYLAGFAWFSRDRFPDQTPWALAVAHGVGVFFAFLVAGIANPFELVSPVPLDGPGPNPLLQNHILMVIHPPMLYLGYVGMTVPFAMGSAALLAGKLDAAWTRALRRWMLVPWGFLTVGIVLGGWWSYEVLGWGGWWAWDPVENASFLPWLTGTAFLHSAMVMERKDHLKGWSLALVLSTFLLTILGTFMTRSGVFNSVHSFTQSPIGPVFLGFLGLGMVFSVLLLAARVDRLAPPPQGLAGPVSRETGFLANNLLFAAFTLTVLLGTVYPLLNEAITGEQVSVGQPYFDRMSGPIGLAILFLMGVGPALPWGAVPLKRALQRVAMPASVAVTVMGLSVALGARAFWPVATFGAGAFAFVVTTQEVLRPAQARAKARGQSLLSALASVLVSARRRYGGYIVHVGVIVIGVSHAAATAWSTKDTVTLAPGESTTVQGYTVAYQGSAWEDQPHRKSLKASLAVTRGDRDLGVVAPRLNHYKTMDMPIGTPAVRTGLREDLYLSLVNVGKGGESASFDVMVKPLVGWLWFGGGLMMLGTLVAAWPSTRKARAATTAPAPTAEVAGK